MPLISYSDVQRVEPGKLLGRQRERLRLRGEGFHDFVGLEGAEGGGDLVLSKKRE